jgi:hypothetical protein
MDSVDMISDAEADAAMKVANELSQQVRNWFEENHPEWLK